MLREIFAGPMMENRPFNTQLRCYSVAMFPGNNEQRIREIELGGKILLPASCLDWLTRLHIAYPMLFKLTNPKPESQRVTHCGVLEFLAEEGKCHMPYWMMRHLLLEEGQVVQIEYVNLPTATYAKFKPQNQDFLDISNPRVVLEMKLRNFACLTKGDMIALEYNNRMYEILVTDIKPGNAASIVECDMNVEFDAPEGYVDPKKEPSRTPNNARDSMTQPEVPTASSEYNSSSGTELAGVSHAHPDQSFVPFSGPGMRLDGKGMTSEQKSLKPKSSVQEQRIVPDLNYKPGSLTFIRNYKRLELREKEEAEAEKNKNQGQFEAFAGGGQTIRASRNKDR